MSYIIHIYLIDELNESIQYCVTKNLGLLIYICLIVSYLLYYSLDDLGLFECMHVRNNISANPHKGVNAYRIIEIDSCIQND